MPRPAILVEVVAERRGERRVRLAALVRRRRSIRGRARERVAEREQLERDRDEAGALGRRERRRGPGRAPSRPARARPGRRSPRPPRAPARAAPRPGSDSTRRANARSTLVSIPSGRSPGVAGTSAAAAASSTSASGLPSVASNRRSAVPGRQRPAGVLLEHRRGRLAVQALELERGQERVRRRGRLAGAHREQRRDRVGEQPADGEQDRGQRRLVDPVGVVDRHQQRLLLRVGRQQAERRRADQEAVALDAGREPERAAQRGGLRRRDVGEPVERRPQQREQAGERDLRLGLHAARPQHAHALGALDRRARAARSCRCPARRPRRARRSCPAARRRAGARSGRAHRLARSASADPKASPSPRGTCVSGVGVVLKRALTAHRKPRAQATVVGTSKSESVRCRLTSPLPRPRLRWITAIRLSWFWTAYSRRPLSSSPSPFATSPPVSSISSVSPERALTRNSFASAVHGHQPPVAGRGDAVQLEAARAGDGRRGRP